MSLAPQAVNFADVLEATRVQVRTVAGLDDAFVRSVASDQYRVTFEDKFVALRPLGPTPVTDSGAGRFARIESRVIRVYVNVRSSLDSVGSDPVALGKLFELENTINDACDEWWPKSADGSVLTIEPLHPVDSSAGPPLRQAVNDDGEVWSLLAYQAVYVRPNNRSAP